MHFKKTLPARDIYYVAYLALAKNCKSNKLFKVTQAVSSRLVEERLQELQPLFAQDKVMIGKLEVLQKNDKILNHLRQEQQALEMELLVVFVCR